MSLLPNRVLTMSTADLSFAQTKVLYAVSSVGGLAAARALTSSWALIVFEVRRLSGSILVRRPADGLKFSFFCRRSRCYYFSEFCSAYRATQ